LRSSNSETTDIQPDPSSQGEPDSIAKDYYGWVAVIDLVLSGARRARYLQEGHNGVVAAATLPVVPPRPGGSGATRAAGAEAGMGRRGMQQSASLRTGGFLVLNEKEDRHSWLVGRLYRPAMTR